MTDYAPGTVTTDLERVLQPNDTTVAPTPAVRGGSGPNRNLPTVDTTPPLSTDPLPPISYSEAQSRKEELFSGQSEAAKAWRDKYFANDIQAKREYDQIVRGLTIPPAAPTDEREQVLDELRRHAHIPAEVTEEILSGRASTPADVAEALDAKQQFFNDEAWMERYEKGDRQAHTQLAMINLILSRRVRDDPRQP